LGLKTFLREKTFKNIQEAEKSVSDYFGSKNEDFFYRGIHELPDRWAKVIAVNGDYFE
jgi:hypothetical protein